MTAATSIFATMRIAPLLIAVAFVTAAAAQAQTPKPLLSDPGVWGAFELQENGSKTCYMAAQPGKTAPKDVKRGEVWLLITHRPKKKVKNEVSVYTGYPYKKDSKVAVAIDGKGYSLFTHEETAWARTPSEDGRLVKAMRRGNRMIVRGTSQRGTKTTDTYSLRGFTKAHKAISKACKVK